MTTVTAATTKAMESSQTVLPIVLAASSGVTALTNKVLEASLPKKSKRIGAVQQVNENRKIVRVVVSFLEYTPALSQVCRTWRAAAKSSKIHAKLKKDVAKAESNVDGCQLIVDIFQVRVRSFSIRKAQVHIPTLAEVQAMTNMQDIRRAKAALEIAVACDDAELELDTALESLNRAKTRHALVKRALEHSFLRR